MVPDGFALQSAGGDRVGTEPADGPGEVAGPAQDVTADPEPSGHALAAGHG